MYLEVRISALTSALSCRLRSSPIQVGAKRGQVVFVVVFLPGLVVSCLAYVCLAYFRLEVQGCYPDYRDLSVRAFVDRIGIPGRIRWVRYICLSNDSARGSWGHLGRMICTPVTLGPDSLYCYLCVRLQILSDRWWSRDGIYWWLPTVGCWIFCKTYR